MNANRIPLRIIAIIVLCLLTNSGHAELLGKILYINSYHAGHNWGDGIARGILSRLIVEDVEIRTEFMDSLRQREPDQIINSAIRINQVIDEFNPDVVITSDDPAAKYVIAEYYKDAELPFVFCGVNWDASVYGFPFSNTTGMVEVFLINSLASLLSQHTTGRRLGLLSNDTLSARSNYNHYSKHFGSKLSSAYFVNSYDEWQDKFKILQSEVDMLIIENPIDVNGWESDHAEQFIFENVSIPIGSNKAWLSKYSLITLAQIPEEQGWWAADSAVGILNGKSPTDIPVVKNEEGKLIVNIKMAEKVGILFQEAILQIAETVKY